MTTSSEKWTQRGDTYIAIYSRDLQFRTHLSLTDLRAFRTYKFTRIAEYAAIADGPAEDQFVERFGFRVASKTVQTLRKSLGIH